MDSRPSDAAPTTTARPARASSECCSPHALAADGIARTAPVAVKTRLGIPSRTAARAGSSLAAPVSQRVRDGPRRAGSKTTVSARGCTRQLAGSGPYCLACSDTERAAGNSNARSGTALAVISGLPKSLKSTIPATTENAITAQAKKKSRSMPWSLSCSPRAADYTRVRSPGLPG